MAGSVEAQADAYSRLRKARSSSIFLKGESKSPVKIGTAPNTNMK